MTGRELIIYILSNNLEDEPIFEEGHFVGFMTVEEAAEKLGVGIATIMAWVALGKLNHLLIGTKIYIPADSTHPYEGDY